MSKFQTDSPASTRHRKKHSPLSVFRQRNQISINGNLYTRDKEARGEAKEDKIYNKLNNKLQDVDSTTQKQILDIYSNVLSDERSFKGINLNTSDNSNNIGGLYSKKSKNINFFLKTLYKESIDPIQTVNHELTHASSHLLNQNAKYIWELLLQDESYNDSGSDADELVRELQEAVDPTEGFGMAYLSKNLSFRAKDDNTAKWPVDEFNAHLIQELSMHPKGRLSLLSDKTKNTLKKILVRQQESFNKYTEDKLADNYPELSNAFNELIQLLESRPPSPSRAEKQSLLDQRWVSSNSSSSSKKKLPKGLDDSSSSSSIQEEKNPPNMDIAKTLTTSATPMMNRRNQNTVPSPALPPTILSTRPESRLSRIPQSSIQGQGIDISLLRNKRLARNELLGIEDIKFPARKIFDPIKGKF